MKNEIKAGYIQPNYLTEKDISKILRHAKTNHHHYLWIGLLYTGGLTIQELLGIKTRDFNLKSMTLIIPGGTKLKSRKISIPDSFKTYLCSEIHMKDSDDYIFSGRNGKLHTRTVQKLFDKMKEKTGIELSIHAIRKSLAIHLYKAGWSEKSICMYLGHSQIYSTKKMLRGILPPESNIHPIHNILINAA